MRRCGYCVVGVKEGKGREGKSRVSYNKVPWGMNRGSVDNQGEWRWWVGVEWSEWVVRVCG